MRTHIFSAIMTAFLLSACASKEGRTISSTQSEDQKQTYQSKAEGNAFKDVGRR